MRAMRVLAFFLFFGIDVTVRAAGLSQLKSLVEEPHNCLRREEICAIATHKGTKFPLVVGSAQIILGDDTILTRLDRDHYDLVKGEIWVTSEDEMTIGSEYGEILIHRGEALISRTPKRITAKSVKGSVQLFPRGGEILHLERGFENSLMPVSTGAVAQSGVPQLIDLKSFFRKLAALHVGEKRTFLTFAESWLQDWPEIVEKASVFHQDLVKRAVAMEEERARLVLARKRAAEAERQKIRRMFRDKTFNF